MQKGGGCKTDWRWEGKCSSPGGCCKGGRKRRTRRRRRRKKGRGKKHKSSPTSRDKYSGPERRTLKKKTKRPPSDGGNGLKIIEKYKRIPVVAGNPTTTTRVGRPSSGRTVSTESGTSLPTAERVTLDRQGAMLRWGAPSDPRHQLQAIIEAGGPDQTDDEYRQRIAALLAADGGTAPRIVADESYPDLFDYHQATVGGELGGAFGGPRTSPVTFSEVLMEPKLRKWEKDVQQEAQQKEAKKQWKKALNLGPVQRPRGAAAVRREQYGGQGKGGLSWLHDRWIPKPEAVSGPNCTKLLKKIRAGKGSKPQLRHLSDLYDKKCIMGHIPGTGLVGGRKRKTRRRKRRGGQSVYANNVRGNNVSRFNRALAEKEWGPAKEPIKRDMITPERKKRYDQHIAKLKPKEWWNPGTWFGGGRRRTRKQRGGEIQKLTATDMMRNSTTILGHKINEIIDDVNELTKLPPPKVKSATKTSGGRRKTRRNRRRRRKKSRKSAR